jgi:hypothetical protein
MHGAWDRTAAITSPARNGSDFPVRSKVQTGISARPGYAQLTLEARWQRFITDEAKAGAFHAHELD